jgi:hypothetical protein
LNGEFEKEKDDLDWKKCAVYNDIKDLLGMNEGDLQKEIYFYDENEHFGVEMKFFDKKLDETNFNQNEFIINIHIDNKNEGGDKESGTLLHFVKELNKNKIIPNVFEFANDVKKKSYMVNRPITTTYNNSQ